MNENEIIAIERGSNAWHAISNAVLTGTTIRLAEYTGETVKIKINGGMWSPPLSTLPSN